jgi:L-2-hydroxyglutarate oxidase
MDKILIIGGGIVGLATAYKIQQLNNAEITLFEKENDICLHQSGRNSGVIHSGIYYKPGSKKAINCIQGYKEILNFCNKYKIPFELCGKLIVGNNHEDLEKLKKIKSNGEKNGLNGLKIIEQPEIKKYEPLSRAKYALHVPQTGIIDYKRVGLKLKELIINSGGKLYVNKQVIKVNNSKKNVEVITNGNYIHFFDKVIVCAGLQSSFIGKKITKKNLKTIPFKGIYYKLKSSKSKSINSMIYPIPDSKFPFLGVHITKSIDGNVYLGPNAVLALSREAYKFNQIKVREFFEILLFPGLFKLALKYPLFAINEILYNMFKTRYRKKIEAFIGPLSNNELEIVEPGIRAQLLGSTGELIDDFKIEQSGRVTFLLNAPSPAATSCFSIANDIIIKL